MASVNLVVLCGNLTRDPDVRTIPSGQSVADLGLAVNESYKNKAGEQVDAVCFVDVVVWGKTAEACGQHLRKGAPVLVEGKLQLDTWEKDGEKRSKLRVRADRVHFLSAPKRDEAARPSAPVDNDPPF
jgi:single-strand DNA-binding protein